jgi:3-hydroxyisobutyrate dehydrogenase-like beta-hydroxyacid dehydrogenase
MKAMLKDDYPERAFSIKYALKDMEYLLEFAKQAQADLKGARLTMEALERAAVAGHRGKYFPVLAKTL